MKITNFMLFAKNRKIKKRKKNKKPNAFRSKADNLLYRLVYQGYICTSHVKSKCNKSQENKKNKKNRNVISHEKIKSRKSKCNMSQENKKQENFFH